MNPKELETKLRDLLSTLMTDNAVACKAAKKEIERLWHHETEAFKISAKVALEFLPKFDDIKTTKNKEAFVSGLKMFYLVLGDDYFDILKGFTLKVVQLEDGHIRRAMEHVADWLYISLSSRTDPYIRSANNKMSEKQTSEHIMARKQYLDYVNEVEILLNKYDHEDGNVEYIEDMKPSIHKSLQQLWARLTESSVYRETLEATTPIPLGIFERRKEIEHELIRMLRVTHSDFDLGDIKDAIFNESESGDMQDIIRMFDDGNINNLSNVLELVTDAWNYFPHKSLGGKCPREMMSNY